MTGFWRLLDIEVRRALSRRIVRTLLAVAVVGCTAAGVITYASTQADEVATAEGGHIARVVDWWAPSGDSVIVATILFLTIGALIGGASVVGAEWRTGSLVTTLTWAPRRGRVLAARLTAVGALAAILSVALQAVLFVAVLPTIVHVGTFDGVDQAWLGGTTLALLRSAALCALAAVVGATVASIGRNTTAALGAAFVELAIVEAVVRAAWPGRARWLLGENVATFVTWKPLEDAGFHRGPALATLTLLAYTAALVAAAIILFRRRDIGTAT